MAAGVPTRLADQRLLVFPIQYSRRDTTWLCYLGSSWTHRIPPVPTSRASMRSLRKPYNQTTCAPCHTSQLAFARAPCSRRRRRFNQVASTARCAWPSGAHAEGMKSGRPTFKSAIDPPVRFAGITADQSVAICSQCHAQSAVHGRGRQRRSEFRGAGPMVSDRSDAPAVELSAPCALSRWPVSRNHFDQRGLRAVVVLPGWGATCASCHNPHPRTRRPTQRH